MEIETRDFMRMRDNVARFHAGHVDTLGQGFSRHFLQTRHVHLVLSLHIIPESQSKKTTHDREEIIINYARNDHVLRHNPLRRIERTCRYKIPRL